MTETLICAVPLCLRGFLINTQLQLGLLITEEYPPLPTLSSIRDSEVHVQKKTLDHFQPKVTFSVKVNTFYFSSSTFNLVLLLYYISLKM